MISAYSCAAPAAPVSANVSWKADDGALKWGGVAHSCWRKQSASCRDRCDVARKRTQLSLDIARDGDKLGAWSLSNAPAGARFALNAGQFTDAGPWGWVIHRGREQQRPGTGALAGALVVDTAGAWSLIDAGEIPTRRFTLSVREALQSYPTLISSSGRIPASLCTGSKDVDLTHRDARLVVGTLSTGELVIAMSRFDGLGTTAERLPLGPTTPGND